MHLTLTFFPKRSLHVISIILRSLQVLHMLRLLIIDSLSWKTNLEMIIKFVSIKILTVFTVKEAISIDCYKLLDISYAVC